MNTLRNLSVGSMGILVLLGGMLVFMAGVQTVSAADGSESSNGEAASAEIMETEGGSQQQKSSDWALFLAVAATVGMGCISAGYAVAKVGAAALGAASEKPEILGRALIFVGLAEGIAIYGLIVGLIMLNKA
ncbi:MAG: ATP synthase subunit C [Lentisphaeria bacterium]